MRGMNRSGSLDREKKLAKVRRDLFIIKKNIKIEILYSLIIELTCEECKSLKTK